MGISHFVLEPELSVLGHIDSNELLKKKKKSLILMCSPLLLLHSLKVLYLGPQKEFLSQLSYKE